MKMTRALLTASLMLLTSAAASAHAQFYKLHNADVGGSALGAYTTTLTSNGTGVTQSQTQSLGGEFTLRDHPVAWAGVEFNYAYMDNSQVFNSSAVAYKIKTNTHEATAAYLFHPHFRKLQPFLAVGGGAIDFAPVNVGNNQWRGAGLVELGFDIPTSNPHFGFRAQGRSLIYRNPNFAQPLLASKTWVATAEPSFGFWMRF